jgi:anaerobic magnesium-protoporphyrin IX monomethyl ester cyclase
VGLPFFCNVRADLIVRWPHKADLLARAGAYTVSMGIEAGNDRLRKELLKRHMSKEEIIGAGNLLRSVGINVTATNILGLPGTRLEDDLETMRLNADAKISYGQAFIFQPYPGTELSRYAEEAGFSVGSFEDISSISWERSTLLFQEVDDKRQVEHLQRWFAVGVEFPWMEPLIRRLIKLPHHPLIDNTYWFIHKTFKGYLLNQRVYATKFNVTKLFKVAQHFFRMNS